MTVDDKILIKGFIKSIIEGKLTIKQVPDKFKEAVTAKL